MTRDAWSSLQAEDLESLGDTRLPQLICREPSTGVATRSQAIPVEHQGSNTLDVFLLAKHGLTADLTNCSILWGGQNSQLMEVESGASDDLKGDWAVVSARLATAQKPTRLPIRSVTMDDIDILSRSGGTIHILNGKLNDLDHTCEVRVPRKGLRDPVDGDAIFVSDCPMVAGKSGAPAIARVGNTPSVIGIGLGYRFELSRSHREWKDLVAVIRVIDPTIQDAVARISQD